MLSEFEEKEFEAILYNQIEKNCNMVWSPGQCFEKYIGIDRASFIEDLDVWKKLGYSYHSGRSMIHEELDELWKKLGIKRKLPNFNLNLFIQAKRPYCYEHLPKKVSNFLGANSGYKFVINSEQQTVLECISERLKNNVLIVYAAPKFGTLEELYSNAILNTMIEHTTFPEVEQLHGHKEWYYNEYNGVACSHPEKMSDISLIEKIRKFIMKNKIITNKKWIEYSDNSLSFLCAEIISSLRDWEKGILQFEKVAQFFNDINIINSYSKYYKQDIFSKKISEFMIVNRFCEIFNVNWFILYNNEFDDDNDFELS